MQSQLPLVHPHLCSKHWPCHWPPSTGRARQYPGCGWPGCHGGVEPWGHSGSDPGQPGWAMVIGNFNVSKIYQNIMKPLWLGAVKMKNYEKKSSMQFWGHDFGWLPDASSGIVPWYVYMYIYIYVYIYMCMYVFVCVCMCRICVNMYIYIWYVCVWMGIDGIGTTCACLLLLLANPWVEPLTRSVHCLLPTPYTSGADADMVPRMEFLKGGCDTPYQHGWMFMPRSQGDSQCQCCCLNVGDVGVSRLTTGQFYNSCH